MPKEARPTTVKLDAPTVDLARKIQTALKMDQPFEHELTVSEIVRGSVENLARGLGIDTKAGGEKS